jgi:peptidoglycan/xylan/chitin deacetylase (PgdA/CDA1 family)
VNTPSVLKTLAEECTTGIFFPIGKHATYYPEILRQVMAAGHSIGSHTWSHAALVNKKLTEQQRKDEIEKGFSAVKWALGRQVAGAVLPLPRAATPAGDGDLSRLPQHRNLLLRPRFLRLQGEQGANHHRHRDAQGRKERQGHHPDARLPEAYREALPELLKKLKAGGYKVVAMRAKTPVQTLAQYDEDIVKELKLPTVSSRPVSSVVQTISE